MPTGGKQQTYAEKISIARAIRRLYEMIADAVSESERVVEVLPVGARDYKCAAVRELPPHEWYARAEPRVPVNVFDSAYVESAVDEEPRIEGLALDAGDEVAACKQDQKN